MKRNPISFLILFILLSQSNLIFSQATESWYIRRYPPEPWTWAPILNTNITEMDEVFGEGVWHSGYYDEVDPTEAFGPTTCFVFMEGGDDHAIPMNDFLLANMSLIESWVLAGGSLFMNAAPNYGTSMDFGFNAVVLVYPAYTSTGYAVDLAHPIFNGPYVPVGSSWNGNYFGHAIIDGPDLTPLIDDGAGSVVCAETSWGAGKVIFGGMTTTGWHDPLPEASNLRMNIFKYLASYAFLDFSYAQEIYCHEDEDPYPIMAVGADTGIFVSEPPGLVIDPITGKIDLSESLTGTYAISNVFEGIGCKSDSSQFTLTIATAPVADIIEDFFMCEGATEQLTSFGGISYEWIPPTYLDDPFAQNPNLISPETDMVYSVVVTDENGCHDTASVNVTLYENPIIDAGEDQYILSGSFVELNASGGVTYAWSPEETLSDPNIQNPLSYATENTTYYVYGTDNHGCIGIDSVNVILREDAVFGFPNAFSPNSDGVNDFFLPIAYGTVVDFNFTIYNRWGELIFENTADLTKGWNGTFEEEDQPMGNYIYYFTAIDGTGQDFVYKGNVTLVR